MKEEIEKYIFTKFCYKKGMPIRFRIKNEEITGLFFKKISSFEIQVLLINNEFKESEKIIINKNQII